MGKKKNIIIKGETAKEKEKGGGGTHTVIIMGAGNI